MADKGGGAGGFGWFIMGLLIGVTGTLVMEKVVHHGERHAPVVTTVAPVSDAAADSDAKPKLVVHPGGLSGAKAKAAAAVEQSADDVADDAAAAGMTSRTPRPPPPPN